MCHGAVICQWLDRRSDWFPTKKHILQMGSAQWRSMAASVRTDGGSDAGGCPRRRRDGDLEPPCRAAISDPGNQGLAEVSNPGVAQERVRTLRVVRERILPRPVQPRTTPGPLCDLEAARLLPGAVKQRSGSIPTAHRGHGDRGAGPRCHYEKL